MAAVIVVALAIVIPLVVVGGDDEDDDAGQRAPDDTSSSTAAVPDASGSPGAEDTPPPTDLDDVQVYDDLPTTHVDGDVDYEQSPPVGGEHDPAWLECGAYDEPVRDENAVHDLEHGAVWITYDTALADDDVAALEAALPDNGIMSPYDGLPSPVVVTAWGHQLALVGADDPRLPLFVAAYGDGQTAPEPFASCAGGLRP